MVQNGFRVRVFTFLLLSLTAIQTSGQLFRGGDQLTLSIEHPPAIQAKLDHIAFTQPQGPCSEPFSDALVENFSKSGAIVIDRMHLKNIVAEHKLNVSGLVDSKMAAKIGRLIGAGSLVFIKVHECKTYHTDEVRSDVDLKGDISKNKVPTTRGLIRASVQIIDMTTGVTIAAPMVDAKAIVHAGDKASMKEKILDRAGRLRNQGKETVSPYPPEEEVHTELFATAVQQVHRALFAWRETKKITFYNDRECGLNEAYVLLQASDYEGASRAAQSSVDKCKSNAAVKPAAMARALYNHAMTLFLVEDYSAAMKALAEAARFEPSKPITDAMAETNKAWSAQQAKSLGTGKKPTGRAATATAATKTEPSKLTLNRQEKEAPTVEAKLRQLEDLHKKKLITDEEYAAKRKKILEDM